MAVDEAILEAAGKGESLPTLRLYAWEPACLSLGFAQKCGDVDLFRLQQHGWELVRRPTGGRAILHTDELTYSVTGLLTEPVLEGSVLESYRRLAEALLAALHKLNIPAMANSEALTHQQQKRLGPVCFEVPSNYEIVVEGKKLIGSAQARRKEGVLQHGSLPLYGNLGRITEGLVFPDEAERQEAAARLHQRALTCEEELGNPLAWELAAQAFEQAFGETLNLELVSGALSESELERARQLEREKYAHPSWTERV